MIEPRAYFVNDTVALAMNFQTDAWVDVDPSTVVIKTLSPSGVTTTYTYGTDAELIRLDTGDYYIEVVPNESGRWLYRWQTTGTGTATAREGSFVVRASAFYDDPARDAYRS